ncbi:MAG: sulfatase [Planctomycetota bacterium]|nr:MAG: sulfatase [Planctomycetota bacterium]
MRSGICFALAALMLASGVGLAADGSVRRPNIVVILADDLGYGDVHCNNPERGKIPTPHIDKLAAQGMRFTDGHSSSGVCSPSRYALLTGRYHWRTRLQSGIVGSWGAPLIAPDRLTIAGLAKQHGYRTACIGKWHLGRDWPITQQQRPLFANFGPNFAGLTDAHRDAWKEVFSQAIPGGPTTRGFDSYFGTDVPNWPPYCFIENDRTVGIPSELLPPDKLRKNQASLQGPALADWQLEPILPVYLPLTTPHTPLAVNAEWKGKSGLENDCADLIMETDAVVGRVLAALEKAGEANNSLVLFTSDNGFAAYTGAKELEQRGHYPSGPLRGYKTDVYEGGHRVPFIVRWPALVKPGSVSHQLVHQADVLATLAEILGTKLPDHAGEDSFSLLQLLKGDSKPVREQAVSCAASGVPGIRVGNWKLILTADPKSKTEVQLNNGLQLYNLADDLGETKNLAADHPDRVASMMSVYDKLITNGRSTPGPLGKNDVEVIRHPAKLPAASKTKSKRNAKD